MKKIIIDIVEQAYEITLRLIGMFLVGLVITQAFTVDLLTGSLWVTANHWMYGLLLTDVAVIIALTVFAPDCAFNVWKKIYSLVMSLTFIRNKTKILLKELKNFSTEEKISVIYRYVKAVSMISGSDVEEKLTPALHGLETTQAMLGVKSEEESDLAFSFHTENVPESH